MSFTTTVKEVIANDKSGLLTKHPSWERVLLADIATILNGAPFDSALFSNAEGFPLIRIRDVLIGATNTYYTGDYDETYVVNKGELLIGMDGDFNSAFWNSEPALLNQRVCKITPDETRYSQKLLGLLLPGYLAAINQHTSAITVKHLSSKTIGEIELPLPPRAEQTRIIQKLEELLSDLDAGIAELKAAQKKLAQYRQSLLKAAVEGALTAEWRARRKSVRPESFGSAQDRLVEGRFSVSPQTEGGDSSPVRSKSVHASTGSGRTDLLADAREYPQNPVRPEPVEACPERSRRGRTAGAETGPQLLERILKERRARWEAKQLAKFESQGKTPPKDWKAKYPEPVNPDTSNLPELPEGWAWASLDMLGEIASGVAKGTKRDSSIILREVPYLRVANVQRGYLDLTEVKTILATEEDIKDLTLQYGDVLFNEGGDRDKLGRGWVWRNEVADCIHQNHVFRLRPYFPEILSELISHHANTFGKLWFQAAGKQTTNLASINMGILRSFPVPVAPACEQEEILSQLENHLTLLSDQESSVSLGLKQALAQRKNILKAAFSGQLVPQNPNDEPASVLLERIRAERDKQPKPRRGRAANTDMSLTQAVRGEPFGYAQESLVEP